MVADQSTYLPRSLPMADDSRNPASKSGGKRRNTTLYILLAGVGILGFFYWSVQSSNLKITPRQFDQLVVASSRVVDGGEIAKGSDGIHYPTGTGESVQTLRLTELRDVRVYEKVIVGIVDKQVLMGKGADEEAVKTQIRVNRGTSDGATDQSLETLLNEHNIKWEYAHESGWARAWPFLLITGLVLFFFISMLRRLGGAGSPAQFGRSRGRLFALEDLGITFKDVAGLDEAVEEVWEVVDFLQSPERYQRLGGRIPRGVLLLGPPGTGKTLLAKAIAGEAGVPFFSLSGSDFVEMFVGVGAARVRDMFQQAESKAPCIIFLDELDAIGKSRGGSSLNHHDEREQTLNALLVEMDGFNSNNGVIVIAATNRPETLDQALMRPGRFDRQVVVDQPDVRGRHDILKIHVSGVKLDQDVDLKQIASITPGLVGADLANLVNEAALLAARGDNQTVTMAEFNESVERVTAGLAKKQRVMNPDEKLRIAYHESGHALVASSLPNTDPVHKVSIIPRGLAALGYTLQRPEGDRFLMTQSELESKIHVLLAGTVTEELIFHDISTGASNDLERATSIARSMVMDYGMSELGRVNFRSNSGSAFLSQGGLEEQYRLHSEKTAQLIDEQVKRIIDQSIVVVRDILVQRRDALEAITVRLMEVESVDGVELKQLIEDNTESPRVVPGTLKTTDEPADLAVVTPDAPARRQDGTAPSASSGQSKPR
jgi:cell division protease FtsH